MATIEQRAKEYVNNNFHRIADEMPIEKGMETIYVESATDQQLIDLAHAKAFAAKWLDEIITLWLPSLKDEPYHTKALNDIYRKLEKAMLQQ